MENIISENIILSICIPTCNRPIKLKRLLESIFSQVTPEVEIVIGDDSSGFETEKIIKKNFPNDRIFYYRNKHQKFDEGPNSSKFDRNLLGITKQASGKYIWWFGDDDEMQPGAINHVLDIIKQKSNITLIWVNHYVFSQNIPAFNWRKDKFFEDKNQVIEDVANLLGFISSIIFRKDGISNIDEKKMEKFIGSGFINLYLVMHILSKNGKFFYINYPYVCIHLSSVNEISYDGFQVFTVNFYNIVMSFKKSFLKKSFKKMLAKNFGHVWRGILVSWLRGYDTPKGKLWIIFKLYWNFPEFWLAAPFFMMPKFITKFGYFFYKKILRRTYSTVE